MQDSQRSQYHEYRVGPPLSEHVICLWSQTIQRETPTHTTILPDACVDIVFIDDASAVVAGPATTPIHAHLPEGATVVGARFAPGAAASWLHVPAWSILNLDVNLIDLWRSETDELTDRIAAAPTVPLRLTALTEALLGRMPTLAPRDRLIDAGVAALAAPDPPDVDELGRSFELSQRQLLRRFKHHLGYGPKQLQRILRFQRLLHLAATPPHGEAATTSLADGLALLAAEAGYADQAHMSREVRQLSGSTPRSLLQRHAGTLGLSDLFKPQTAGMP